MLSRLIALLVLFGVAGLATCFDAPIYEYAAEADSINNKYHKFVDNIVWGNAFKWANASTGSLNFGVLAAITASFAAELGAITTDTFRQCDRLTPICYICEDGAANVASSSVQFLVIPKLMGQDNNILNTDIEKLDTQTFVLTSNLYVPYFTASLACRANSTCYPANMAETIRGILQNPRQLTFQLTSGPGGLKLLIDRINTGSRYNYYPKDEAGVRVLSVNFGQELVPDSVFDSGLTGVFCIPEATSSRVHAKVRHYTYADLPAIMNGWLQKGIGSTVFFPNVIN